MRNSFILCSRVIGLCMVVGAVAALLLGIVILMMGPYVLKDLPLGQDYMIELMGKQKAAEFQTDRTVLPGLCLVATRL